MSDWESKEMGPRALLGQHKWKEEYEESMVLSSIHEYPTIALFLPFLIRMHVCIIFDKNQGYSVEYLESY